MGKVKSFQQMVLEQATSYPDGTKKNLDLNLKPPTKIDSRWIIDLNIKARFLMLLEENVE